jgi:hypothetical protein
MLDELLEESWFLQEILQKEKEQGIEQEKARAEQERVQILERQRQILVELVENRYASLVPLVRKKVDTTSDISILQQLVLQLSFASSEEEVRKHLATQ